MKLTNRELILAAGAIVLIWIFFQAGEVLIPFILAGIFAFALNPVVSMLSRYVKLPRTASILIVYVVLISLTITALAFITTRLIAEIRQATAGTTIDATAKAFIESLPSWEIGGQEFSLRALANQALSNLSNFTSNIESQAVSIFQGVLREGVYFLVFLVTGFYLLKDGRKLKSAVESIVPEAYREDFLVLWGKLQVIMGNYLRGQLLLMIIIGSLSYVILESLGVRYALILAIIAGLLEVVPIIGPIVAGIVAVSVTFFTAENRFGFDATTLAVVVAVSYFVLQQLENYVIVPGIYSRLTALHPALVIFAVIIGGAVFGPIGFLLAVPVTASVKVIAQYLASKS